MTSALVVILIMRCAI